MTLMQEINLADFPAARPLLVGQDTQITYGDLSLQIEKIQEAAPSGLVALIAENTPERIATYLACFVLHLPVLLLEKDVEQSFLTDVIKRFDVSHVIGAKTNVDGFTQSVTSFGEIWQTHQTPANNTISPELSLLLATSGSTGNPKFVRLSRSAVLHNARAIALGLDITPLDRAITSLPFSYTYGLSVINSHFVNGATICVTDETMVSAEFWKLVSELEVTSIAGVPTSYRMLKRMRWTPEKYPHLRYLTQAGGRLDDADRQYFLDLLAASNIDFYVMYGQTEATARITITPPADLRKHIDTAGRPLIDGELNIFEPDADGIGAVIYRGPNVMLGYAESSADLARGDEMLGTLETGDLGYLEDGLLFLTGRTKRIVKIFGIRVSLDDVDRWLHQFGTGVATQGNDSVVLFIENPSVPVEEIRITLAEYLHIHSSGVKAITIDALPLLSSGKIDFQKLKQLAADA